MSNAYTFLCAQTTSALREGRVHDTLERQRTNTRKQEQATQWSDTSVTLFVFFSEWSLLIVRLHVLQGPKRKKTKEELEEAALLLATPPGHETQPRRTNRKAKKRKIIHELKKLQEDVVQSDAEQQRLLNERAAQAKSKRAARIAILKAKKTKAREQRAQHGDEGKQEDDGSDFVNSRHIASEQG